MHDVVSQSCREQIASLEILKQKVDEVGSKSFILWCRVRLVMSFGMNLPSLLPLVVTVSVSTFATFAQGQSILFKPYQQLPGQVVVDRSSVDASGGQITVIQGKTVKKGTSSIKRQCSYERRIIGTGPTAKLEYRVLVDQKYRSSSLGTKSDARSEKGPLMGKIIYGLRDDLNRWRLFLKGKTASNQQAVDLVELESYENRRWYKSIPVKVGETWAMEPAFIRNFMERDIGPVVMDASMTFKSIEVMDGERTAVLTFSIKSQARKQDTNARISTAGVDLNGTLYVALDTMLDKKITMSGTLTTVVRQHGVSSVVKSPVTYVVMKSVQ